MEYTPWLEKQIIGRMKVENPWWTEGQISEDYSDMSPRKYFNIFFPLVKLKDPRRSLILMGPRRVGKTVMMHHAMQRLIDEGVAPQNIIYINVETPIYNKILLEQLFSIACRILEKDPTKEALYVFWDEIQYLKNWEVELKSMVDAYRHIKFIASGSAAAELKKRSDESGAGRFTDFHLPPLTFYEYMHLKGYSNLMLRKNIEWGTESTELYSTIDINKLNALFIDYINYGGYPEVVFSDKIRENPGQFIRHDIIDKVLLRDLPSLYGISDVQDLNSLFTMIAYHSGTQFSYEKLSKESGVQKETLKKYINYLEAAFLIKVIKRTDDNAKSYQRETQFKIYLTNPSLRCALFEPLTAQSPEIGDMVETAVYAQWFPRQGTELRYANWRQGRQQGEVDIVGLDISRQKPFWTVEIKWSNLFFNNPGDLKSLYFFMDRNKLTKTLVTTINETGWKDVNGKQVYFLPVACYAYAVGENTIQQKKSLYGI